MCGPSTLSAYHDDMATRRRLTPEQRRDELMDVGATLFAQQSYPDVAMEEVARQAGASRALLYHYFPTKTELFAAIWQRAHHRLLEEIPMDDVLSVRDVLAVALDAHLKFYEANVALVMIANRSPIATDPVVRVPIAEGMRTLCDGVLDAAGVKGRDRDVAATAMAAWIAFVREATVEWLLRKRISRRRVTELCLAVLDAALSEVVNLASPMFTEHFRVASASAVT